MGKESLPNGFSFLNFNIRFVMATYNCILFHRIYSPNTSKEDFLVHKKTWTTEGAAFLSVGFAIYQGHKSGIINPDLIGLMFTHSYEIASIAIPAVYAVGRKIYTKYFRKDKKNND